MSADTDAHVEPIAVADHGADLQHDGCTIVVANTTTDFTSELFNTDRRADQGCGWLCKPNDGTSHRKADRGTLVYGTDRHRRDVLTYRKPNHLRANHHRANANPDMRPNVSIGCTRLLPVRLS